MSNSLRCGLALVAAVVLVAPPPAAAAAVNPAPCIARSGSDATETREDSSVDEGEIRWTESTKYDDAFQWAIKRWQYAGARIKIVADSATTVNDLEFVDYSNAADAAAGNWQRRPQIGATDYIRFNKAKMDGYDTATRRQVATHELGHALGLCHKSNGGSGYVRSIMWTEAHSLFAEPQDVDKANYRKLWG
ncbi:M57 family metalloprotease [Streptomyces sp. NPDC091371]|uniref:M57 family metalloprotease n=1 Tax=Streptomyces sp. NPDC091371 TaxID=3155303 RepID=UPI00343EC35E